MQPVKELSKTVIRSVIFLFKGIHIHIKEVSSTTALWCILYGGIFRFSHCRP